MELQYRKAGAQAVNEPVSDLNPYPTFTPPGFGPPSIEGVPFAADYLWKLALDGRLFVSGDADEDDLVTGQTSLVATTPTFLLRVPANVICLPLFVNLMQAGTVAGGDITLAVEIDNVERYSTGGTPEKVFSPTNARTNACTLLSNPTALTGYGMTVNRWKLGPDVSPAEGAVNGIPWKPELPYLLRGPAALLIYSFAGTTGPSWMWNIGFAEWPASQLDGLR